MGFGIQYVYKNVAPARERGLKYYNTDVEKVRKKVAPARERGLKSYAGRCYHANSSSRSREGAWIEITACTVIIRAVGRSREGAWIEISACKSVETRI